MPETVRRLGEGVRRRFAALFNGELMGDRYVGIYRSLLSASQRGAEATIVPASAAE